MPRPLAPRRTPRPLRRGALPLCLTLALLGRAARGDEPAAPAALVPPASTDAPAVTPAVTPAAAMQAEMTRYFDGERRGGVWLMAIGAPMLAGGAALFAAPGDFARGLGGTVLAFGALELAAGAIFYGNSRSRVPRFTRDIVERPGAYQVAERKRMDGVNGQMRLLEAVEISLILAGGAMASAGALQGQDALAGVGTGLALHAAVLLVYDQLAARRALRYTDALLRFGVSATPGSAARRAPAGLLLTLERRF